jgi:hypothetical protein
LNVLPRQYGWKYVATHFANPLLLRIVALPGLSPPEAPQLNLITICVHTRDAKQCAHVSFPTWAYPEPPRKLPARSPTQAGPHKDMTRVSRGHWPVLGRPRSTLCADQNGHWDSCGSEKPTEQLGLAVPPVWPLLCCDCRALPTTPRSSPLAAGLFEGLLREFSGTWIICNQKAPCLGRATDGILSAGRPSDPDVVNS